MDNLNEISTFHKVLTAVTNCRFFNSSPVVEMPKSLIESYDKEFINKGFARSTTKANQQVYRDIEGRKITVIN